MRRVVFNQKGGVGKTSITTNLAGYSAKAGLRTLLIDLDVQGNSSEYLIGPQFYELEDNVASFFKQQVGMFGKSKDIMDFVYDTPFENLCILPAHPDLAAIERELESRHKIYKLRTTLEKVAGEFDRIYIDTPPALNFYSRSALIAADRLLIPFDCDSFSQQALYNLLDSVEEVREDHNESLEVEGIVVNQFQAQSRLPTQLINQLKEQGLPVLEAYLPSSVKMKESREAQKPMAWHAPSHRLGQAYLELFKLLEPETVSS